MQKTNSTVAKLSNFPSAVTTNSASVAAAKAAPLDGGLPDAAEEEKPPVPDAELTEAEHILVDYFAILSKQNVLTAGH